MPTTVTRVTGRPRDADIDERLLTAALGLLADPSDYQEPDPATGIPTLSPPSEPGALARYPLAKRLALYREAMRGLGRGMPVALCEETLDVWKALGLGWQAKECNCAL